MKGGSAATCMGMGTPLPLEQGSPQAQRDVKGPASGTVTTRTTRECSCGPGSSSSGMRMHSSFSRAIAVPCRPVPSRPHLTPPCGVSDRLCSASATPPLEVWSARQAHASSAARQRWAGQCSATLASPRLPSSVGRRPCPSAARALLHHPTESAGHFLPQSLRAFVIASIRVPDKT